MASMQSRKKHKRPSRSRRFEEPSSFNLKLFVSLGLLLVVLLMKKYDLSIGDFNIDSLYQVVYYNEDLNTLKEKVFFFNNSSNNTDDNITYAPSTELNNMLEELQPVNSSTLIDQQQETDTVENMDVNTTETIIDDLSNDKPTTLPENDNEKVSDEINQ